MNLGNGKIGPLSFHPKKFNDKVLNNDTLVWNIVSNPTDTKSIIGETVGRQSDDHKNILAQRNDLSTNNYDDIPNPQIRFMMVGNLSIGKLKQVRIISTPCRHLKIEVTTSYVYYHPHPA